MEYDDPQEVTIAALARLGITDIQTVKVRNFAHQQVHAVKHRDQQGRSQLCFSRLQRQQEGTWRCDCLTLALSSQEIIHNDQEPRCYLTSVGLSPFYVLGGYVFDPGARVSRVRLVNEEGQTIEDSVEDEMALFLFDRELFRLAHTRVELSTAEGTLLAKHRISFGGIGAFTPAGVWAWSDPRQAMRHFLSTRSYAVKEQDQAREESIRIIQERSYHYHRGYTASYENLQGEQHVCFCGVSQWESGHWLVTICCWDRYLIDEIADREQKRQQPWLVFWSIFPERKHPSRGYSLRAPLRVGAIVDNGFSVTYVRLLDDEGRIVQEEIVSDGMVMFLSEQPLQRSFRVRLYDGTGRLVGQHSLS